VRRSARWAGFADLAPNRRETSRKRSDGWLTAATPSVSGLTQAGELRDLVVNVLGGPHDQLNHDVTPPLVTWLPVRRLPRGPVGTASQFDLAVPLPLLLLSLDACTARRRASNVTCLGKVGAYDAPTCLPRSKAPVAQRLGRGSASDGVDLHALWQDEERTWGYRRPGQDGRLGYLPWVNGGGIGLQISRCAASLVRGR
jgi:hypothetical protein